MKMSSVLPGNGDCRDIRPAPGLLTSQACQQQGMALILVLWVLTLLTIMAGSFTLSMRREASVISSVRDSAQATAIAEAGLVIAQMMLIEINSEQRWKANGRVYEIKYADARVRVQAYSEEGKININNAGQILLNKLINFVGLEDQQQSELAAAILDWRDSNDLVRINGAERRQYENEGLQYHPANKPFQTLDELRLVLGMNEEIYNVIEPLVTIYSKQKQLDTNTASEDVLFIIFENQEDEQENRDNTNEDKKGWGLLSDDEDEDKPIPMIRNKEAVSVIAEAMLNNGAKTMIKAIIMKTAGGNKAEPFKVLEWQRGHTNDASLFANE